ncbi:MAG: hypothetical protein GY786_09350 [Proteobacteria bacterium]|nr:hypothetical protein [Pseudomonadota bacterium]
MSIKKKWLVWFILSFLVLAILFLLGIWTGFKVFSKAKEIGCFPLSEDIVSTDIFPELTEVSFIAFGDTGSGTRDQKQVAKAIEKHCAEKRCDFGLMLGDNFYEGGVLTVDDLLFESLFEDMYANLKFPIFAILGNHDIKGNPLSQILYSLTSKSWKMPNFSYEFNVGPASFFGINSNCGFLQDEQLISNLKNSTSKWNFLFGHHPIFSSGVHGDMNLPGRIFWNRNLSENVDFYLSGHDHHLEHLSYEEDAIDYIVSGAGGKNYLSDTERAKVKISMADSRFRHQDNGFVWFQMTAENVTSRFYNRSGDKLYEFTKTKKDN